MLKVCNKQAKGGSLKADDVEDIDEKYWTEQIATLSSHGLRVIALTRGTIPKDEVTQDQALGPEFVNGQRSALVDHGWSLCHHGPSPSRMCSGHQRG